MPNRHLTMTNDYGIAWLSTQNTDRRGMVQDGSNNARRAVRNGRSVAGRHGPTGEVMSSSAGRTAAHRKWTACAYFGRPGRGPTWSDNVGCIRCPTTQRRSASVPSR